MLGFFFGKNAILFRKNTTFIFGLFLMLQNQTLKSNEICKFDVDRI